MSSKLLQTSSKRHPHPRTAFAELVDNAIGQGKAQRVSIVAESAADDDGAVSSIRVTDSGIGVWPEKIRAMLGYGFSTADAEDVGQYGEGFKTATMKLGKDAVVLSQMLLKRETEIECRVLGLLSRTYHEEEEDPDLKTPYLYFEKQRNGNWRDVTDR